MTRIRTEVVEGRLVVAFRCDTCAVETPGPRGWEPVRPIPPAPEPVRHRCPDCVRRRSHG